MWLSPARRKLCVLWSSVDKTTTVYVLLLCDHHHRGCVMQQSHENGKLIVDKSVWVCV